MFAYEIQCTPCSDRAQVVRIEAASIEEAMQRASRLWVHQVRPPRLLTIIDMSAQVPFAFMYGNAS